MMNDTGSKCLSDVRWRTGPILSEPDINNTGILAVHGASSCILIKGSAVRSMVGAVLDLISQSLTTSEKQLWVSRSTASSQSCAVVTFVPGICLSSLETKSKKSGSSSMTRIEILNSDVMRKGEEALTESKFRFMSPP